jgi:GMP reductase
VRIEDEIKLDYSDVLFRPKRSTLTSRKEVSLERTFTFRNSGKTYTGIPIMAANMDTIGKFSVANALNDHGLFTCIHKHYTPADWDNVPLDNFGNVAVSCGIGEDDLQRLEDIICANVEIKFMCVDVANGYTARFAETIKHLRNSYPYMTIIAGNVVTADMTQELILAGADIVKVGIGSGGVCTTRIKTGVGYPQLSAVIECADAAHGLGGHIIADGGCTCPGDVAKAFGAGADFVMLGSMFAGHVETGTQFYGMSSKSAQDKHGTGLKDYRASEGRTVAVDMKGPIANTVQEILGGLRSTCTYVGAATLKDLPKCTTFIRVNNQYNRIYEKNTTGD